MNITGLKRKRCWIWWPSPVRARSHCGQRSIVVGYKLAGIIGTIVAIIATILPPFIVITIISFFLRSISGQSDCQPCAGRDASRCGSRHRLSRLGNGSRNSVREKMDPGTDYAWFPDCGSLSEHQCRGDHPCMYCHRLIRTFAGTERRPNK
mgnify:CR=1 FL=1